MLAALLSLLPVAAVSTGSGMGMYGTASFGGGGGGDAAVENAKEDYDVAIRMMDKNDFDDAIPRLLKVMRVLQGNADILNDLGYATRMAGNYDDSVEYLQRAISRNPDLKIAYANLGQTYLSMHQPDQARQQLEQLKRLCPGGCDEKYTLSQAMASYSDKAPAPAAPGSGK